MKSKFYDLAESSDVRCNHAAIIINRRSGEIISEGHNYHFHKKSSGPWKKKVVGLRMLKKLLIGNF